MSTTRTANLAERELEACPEQYARIDMELEPGPHSLALVRVLLALGYARIRWRPRTPGVFTAIDEQRIATLVIVDVSPVSDGYPVPRISPGRVRGIHDLCLGYLMDHTRVRKVRADYLAMPSAPVGQGALAVTCRRGVTWAFASERLCAIEVPMGRRVAVLRG